MKPNKREESWEFLTQLNTVLLRTGMIWKRSGTTLSMLNWEYPQMNTQYSWLKPHWTQRLTERRWLKSCSKPSMFHAFMLVSKLSYLFTQQEEPLVLYVIQEMVLPTLYQSMKDSQFHTLLAESNWPEETWLNSWLSSWLKEVTTSCQLLNWKLLEILRKRLVSLLLIMKPPWNNHKTQPQWKRTLNSQMEESSQLEMLDSDAQNISSSH